FAVLYFVLKKTSFGRRTSAIGGKDEARALSDIHVARNKVSIYGHRGDIAALAGSVRIERRDHAKPAAGHFSEVIAIAAVVLGG
ncbi:ABC transporter permease subunit, partial [Bacillus paranthracis]|uniref:ABC transporter permease subunit n=1 Tax=Bacillus paranthracis TaxID=2026186 RepID=UPI002846166D|nr:ribose ABC transporter permease [Bacillus paranthracis]